MDWFYSAGVNQQQNPSSPPLQCAKGSNAEECVRNNIENGCLTHTVLSDEFVVTRKIGSGRSGAFVFFVTRKNDTSGEEYVIKYYADAYENGSDGKVIENDRPFREVVVLCALSGIPGFPCLYQSGCAKRPSAAPWGVPDKQSEVGLYAVMSKVKGVPLIDMDLKKMSRNQALGVSLRILILLKDAQNALGENFRHFDLHPGNIIVDVDNCFPTEFVVPGQNQRLRVDCPSVTIIDFDLSVADVLQYNNNLPKSAPRHAWTKKSPLFSAVAFQERTITWAQSWIGVSKVGAIIRDFKDIENVDIRQWMLITRVLLATHNIVKGGLNACKNAQNCIVTNLHLFGPEFSVGVNTRRGKRSIDEVTDTMRKRGQEAEVERESRARKIRVDNPLNLLIQNSEFANASWSDFERAVYRKRGRYPSIDSVEILAQIAFSRKFILNIMDAALIEMDSFTTSISFIEMRPTIFLRFPKPLRVGVKSWETLSSIAKTGVNFLQSFYTGKKQPFWRQTVFCGSDDPLKPIFQSFESQSESLILLYANEVSIVYTKVSMEVKLSVSIPSKALQYLASKFLKYVGGDKYEYSVSISLEGDPNPCVSGKIEECRSFLHMQLLPLLDIILSKPVFDLLRQVSVPQSIFFINDIQSDMRILLRMPPLNPDLRKLGDMLYKTFRVISEGYSYVEIMSLVIGNRSNQTKDQLVEFGKAIANLDRMKIKIGFLDVLNLIAYITDKIKK